MREQPWQEVATGTVPEPIARPDGTMYRPRMIIALPVIDNDRDSVIVFGTHDIAPARELADWLVIRWIGRRYRTSMPVTGWWRDGFRDGERCWVYDEARGRAAVAFLKIAETGGAEAAR